MEVIEEHKVGYKKTKLGWIPNEWEVKEIKEISLKITDGTHDTPKKTENGIPFITAIHVKDGFIDFENCYYLNKEVHDSIYKRCNPEKGDLLMVNIGAGTTTCAIVNVDFEFSIKNVALIKPNLNVIDPYYLLYYQRYNGAKLFHEIVSGGAQPFLSLKEISKLKLALCSLPEQQKIASLLSDWDEAIENTQTLIKKLQLRKKGLMQQLLTGKIRLAGFSEQINFKRLKSFLKEKSERNKSLLVDRVLSVTNSRGFINQSEQFDRVVASIDLSNYKIVRKGQFAYNPSRVNVGSLDLLKDFDEGLLSPMYVIFETDNKKLLPDFLYYQLKSWWFIGHIPQYVQGSVRDSLSFDGLCSMPFFIPSLKEQKEIVDVLTISDQEINQQQNYLEQLQTQKKGLMQQLLTGNIRVKI